MRDETLFISDLHLTAARPKTVARFLTFASQRASQSASLVILGDLFDVYLGDDDLSSPYREVRDHLRQLTHQGVSISLQHGNRDFLIGTDFERATGIRLLADQEVLNLHGEDTLVTHGDLLCTDDQGYQIARTRVRAPEWKASALGKPLWMRRLYARWYRYKSGIDKGGKTPEIMDANPDAILDMAERHGVKRLIHGHTHRPGVHQHQTVSGNLERFVLPEWDGREWVLVINTQGWHRETPEGELL